MGNCLFLRARGWGIDCQVRTKLQIPGGVPGGVMVTGRIEPCIIKCSEECKTKKDLSFGFLYTAISIIMPYNGLEIRTEI